MQTQVNLFEINEIKDQFSPDTISDELIWFSTNIFSPGVYCIFEQRVNFLFSNWDTRKSASLHFDENKSVKLLQEIEQKSSDELQQRLLESTSTCNNSDESYRGDNSHFYSKNMQRLIDEEMELIRYEIKHSNDLNDLIDKYLNDDLNEYVELCQIESKTKPVKYRKSLNQVKILTKYFTENSNWSKEDWEEIARKTNLSYEAVYKWNHHQKTNPKKLKKL